MKPIMTLSFFLCFSIFGNSQISYEASDYYEVGDTLNYSVLNEIPNDLNFDTTGADITWDYAKLDVETQRVDRMIDPTTAGFRTNWCLLNGFFLDCVPRFNELTNIAGPGVFDLPLGAGAVQTVISHYKKTNESFALTMLGIEVNAGGQELGVPLGNVIPDTIYKFPLEYLNLDSTNSSVFIDGTSFGQDFIYDSKANRVSEVEGWGTLITPFKTYSNVLKVKSTVDQIDTIQAMGQTQPISSVTTTYTWFDKDTKFPVLEVRSQAFGAITVERILYADTARCITPSALFTANPRIIDVDSSTSEATTQFVNLSTNGNEFYWDFGDGTDSAEPNPSHTYQGAGRYAVQLVTCNTVCQPLQCDTFNINVVVRDTSVSLFELSEAELKDKIKVFPNPVSDRLTIKLDPSLQGKALYYTIYNLQGQALISNPLNQQQVAVDPLSNGVYVLKLDDGIGGVMHYKFVKE